MKKFLVQLTDIEREELLNLCRKGKEEYYTKYNSNQIAPLVQ